MKYPLFVLFVFCIVPMSCCSTRHSCISLKNYPVSTNDRRFPILQLVCFYFHYREALYSKRDEMHLARSAHLINCPSQPFHVWSCSRNKENGQNSLLFLMPLAQQQSWSRIRIVSPLKKLNLQIIGEKLISYPIRRATGFKAQLKPKEIRPGRISKISLASASLSHVTLCCSCHKNIPPWK